jgi:hypothetical protein
MQNERIRERAEALGTLAALPVQVLDEGGARRCVAAVPASTAASSSGF